MSLNHYKLYLEQVFQFAETIVIKSEGSANTINDKLRVMHGDNIVNLNDKTSWKYYLNLAGKYHPTDKKIIITSLDTLEQIEFSAANLNIHTATAKAYQYDSRYYRELVSLNPDLEQLILGVLYPIQINYAINAPDFSVIGYPSKYVEANEETLIPSINKWLENYKTRWFNIQYTMSDKLYLTALLGIMYQQLVPLILTYRLRACKTSEAHSYHIREYLASHGMLDEFLDHLTKKQALFFYRNINYIDRNAGKVETFEWLIERILTERDIPVFEITLAQDDSDLLTSYKPKSRFARIQINESSSVDNSAAAFYTLSELLSKEANEAVGNKRYIEQNLNLIDDKIKRSKTNRLKTKVLESKMLDYSDAGFYSIQDVAMDLWCYMSVNDKYAAVINFQDKATNQAIAIPNHIAFLYFIYAYAKVFDIPISLVPEFFATRIAIDPVPTIEDLKKVVDKKYVSEEDLEFLLSLHTPMERVMSTSAFSEFVRKTHISYKAQNTFAFVQNHLYKKALIKNATFRLYKAQRIESEYFGKTFEEVFESINLPYRNFTKNEWADIYKEVYEQATGVEVNLINSKAAMQASMVKLFKKLSSYSIQFLTEINKSTIRSVNWSALRVGDMRKYGSDLTNIQLPIFKLFTKLSSSHDYRFIEVKDLLLKFYTKTSNYIGFIDSTVNAWLTKPKLNKIIDMNRIRPNINKENNCTINIPEDLPEFSNYFQLTLEDKNKVRCVYRDYVSDYDFIPLIDIDTIDHIPHSLRTDYLYRPTDRLPGFKHYYIPKTFDFRVDRNYTELDAFDSNFGELNVNSFKPFTGFHRNDRGFKLSPGPIESVVKSFIYAGGIKYNPGFGFSANLSDDVDIGSFNFIEEANGDIESFTPTFDKQTISLLFNTNYRGINLGNYTLTNMNVSLDQMRLDVNKQTIVVGPLIAGGLAINFKFNTNAATPMHVDFKADFFNTTLQSYKLEVGTFNIGNYNLDLGKETLDIKLASFKVDLLSFTFQASSTEIKDLKLLIASEEIENITFSSGTFQLGGYKYFADKRDVSFKLNVGNVQLEDTALYAGQQNLGTYTLLRTEIDIEKFKWTEHSIGALLVNWQNYNNIVEDMVLDGNLINDIGFNLSESLINDIDFIMLEDLDVNLGTAQYDDVNKEINFS